MFHFRILAIIILTCGCAEYSGGGGGYSGGNGGFRDESSRRGFQEYDAGDDEAVGSSRRSASISTSSAASAPPRRANTTSSVAAATPLPPKAKEPEVDLLGGFGDDDFSAPLATNKALPNVTTAAPVSLDGEKPSYR